MWFPGVWFHIYIVLYSFFLRAPFSQGGVLPCATTCAPHHQFHFWTAGAIFWLQNAIHEADTEPIQHVSSHAAKIKECHFEGIWVILGIPLACHHYIILSLCRFRLVYAHFVETVLLVIRNSLSNNLARPGFASPHGWGTLTMTCRRAHTFGVTSGLLMRVGCWVGEWKYPLTCFHVTKHTDTFVHIWLKDVKREIHDGSTQCSQQVGIIKLPRTMNDLKRKMTREDRKRIKARFQRRQALRKQPKVTRQPVGGVDLFSESVPVLLTFYHMGDTWDIITKRQLIYRYKQVCFH